MKPLRSLIIFSLLLAPLIGCERTPQPYRTPDMESLTPRLQKLFANTKPVCFGRFIIDVPVGTEIGWGPAQIPSEIVSYPGEAGKTHLEIKAKIAEYEGQKHKTEPSMLLAVREGPNKESKIVVGRESTRDNYAVNVNAYLRLPPHAFVINAPTISSEDMEEAVAEISDVAFHLRVRKEDENPTDPGLCIESGFVAEAEGKFYERISIGFRILPDVHLSIQSIKKDRTIESDSLEYFENGFVKGKKDAEKKGFGAEYAKIKWLRKGQRRELAGQIALEYATRQPASKGNVHEFVLSTAGEPNNHLKPKLDITLDTGAAGDQPGKAPSSLTNDETTALWDKILSTLRVRPTTSTTPSKTSAAGNYPSYGISPATPARLPLKAKVTSAANCPQSGVWECAADAPGITEHRRFISAGQPMPYGVTQHLAKGLGGLLGSKEDDPVEISWTLVAYDNDAT